MNNIKIISKKCTEIDDKKVTIQIDTNGNKFYQFEDDTLIYCFSLQKDNSCVCGTGFDLESSLMNTKKDTRLPANIMNI